MKTEKKTEEQKEKKQNRKRFYRYDVRVLDTSDLMTVSLLVAVISFSACCAVLQKFPQIF